MFLCQPQPFLDFKGSPFNFYLASQPAHKASTRLAGLPAGLLLLPSWPVPAGLLSGPGPLPGQPADLMGFYFARGAFYLASRPTSLASTWPGAFCLAGRRARFSCPASTWLVWPPPGRPGFYWGGPAFYLAFYSFY